MNKNVKKVLNMKKIPNLSDLNDISEFITGKQNITGQNSGYWIFLIFIFNICYEIFWLYNGYILIILCYINYYNCI